MTNYSLIVQHLYDTNETVTEMIYCIQLTPVFKIKVKVNFFPVPEVIFASLVKCFLFISDSGWSQWTAVK